RLRRIERQIACGDVIVLGGIYSNGELKIKVNETHYKTCQIEAFSLLSVNRSLRITLRT
uniref:Transcriptional regulator n=1 Tax=Bursaphelenchus xylophilus TaxID=6326 RepID=A0A1I7SJZ9_BURXY